MVRIYLVRHAEAVGNVQEFFQGRTDAPVSEKGRLQLECLAERFKDIKLDAIYSSPLQRTRDTAAAVNKYNNLPVIIDEDIIEINGGRWEGMFWSDIPKKYPEEYDIWTNAINNFQAPEGESTAQVYDRMSAAINRIARQNEGKTIAVVSHGMAIKAYLTYADGIRWRDYKDMDWADNTAVSLIEYENSVPKIIFKNDSSHLPQKLSTLAVSAWCKK